MWVFEWQVSLIGKNGRHFYAFYELDVLVGRPACLEAECGRRLFVDIKVVQEVNVD